MNPAKNPGTTPENAPRQPGSSILRRPIGFAPPRSRRPEIPFLTRRLPETKAPANNAFIQRFPRRAKVGQFLASVDRPAQKAVQTALHPRQSIRRHAGRLVPLACQSKKSLNPVLLGGVHGVKRPTEDGGPVSAARSKSFGPE